MLKRLAALRLPGWTAPLVLLGVVAASYGLLANQLGLYWDAWPLTWIFHNYGDAGLASYFATNRPYWGLLYRLTMPLLGLDPLTWQVFALLWRWVSTVLVWGVVRKLWPDHPDLALGASLLFAVYPGFQQQPIALLYSHFFIVLSAFLGSLWCSLHALQQTRQAWAWTLAALGLSLVNLGTMEYFFLLELLRPLLLWVGVGQRVSPIRQRLVRTLAVWAPYLVLFLLMTAWRIFLFPYQTQNYQPVVLEQLRADPLAALVTLVQRIAGDLWLAIGAMWAPVWQLPDPAALGRRMTLLFAGVVVVVAAGLVIYLLLQRPAGASGQLRRLWSLGAAGLGFAGLLLSGWPFWLTGLPVNLGFPADRFILPFMLGACLLLTGLLNLLPLPRAVRIAILAAAVGLSAGWQLQVTNAYRRDWQAQKVFLWQLSWRMPGLEPGTLLFSNELPFDYVTDNSLAAPLNWIYAPENRSPKMDYMLYYLTLRLTNQTLEKELLVTRNYLAATFSGNTSQALVLFYEPPACLRVLDVRLDDSFHRLTALVSQAVPLSRLELVQTGANPAAQPPMSWLGPQPVAGWCYYFEKAELARQQNDWIAVARLGDEAAALPNDRPNEASERLVFVEGFAHTGQWEKALDFTHLAFEHSESVRPMICNAWKRIQQSIPTDEAQKQALDMIRIQYQCSDVIPTP
jgi:hypothetical protein